MSRSPQAAAALIDELIRLGLTDAVIAPGSRNAPLTVALAHAEADGLLRLHVRVDERSAAFFALGLGRGSGRPALVVCTSGTAAANFHPAVLEADAAGVPLIVLTADRPPALRGVGANQTIEQARLYGTAVRRYEEIAADVVATDADARRLRTRIDRAYAAALAILGGRPGPVHVNVPLADPLITTEPADRSWGARGDGPVTLLRGAPPVAAPLSADPPRTLVLAGDGPRGDGQRIAALAAKAGWPVIAEPTSGAIGPTTLTCGELLAGLAPLLEAATPQRLLLVGRPTLSRRTLALLADSRWEVEVRTAHADWVDPTASAAVVAPGVPDDLTGQVQPDHHFLEAWQAADAAAAQVRAGQLPAGVAGIAIARDVAAALPDGAPLIVGSSMPIRDADLAGVGLGHVVAYANRGVAGIDGTISTALGVALATGGRSAAIVGDLTFLHDAGGLGLAAAEQRPDLAIVVVDNRGGAIFHLLEQGADDFAATFERVFGTAVDVDIPALAQAYGVPCVSASPADVGSVVAAGSGLRIVHVLTDRTRAREDYAQLRRAMADAATATLTVDRAG